MIRYYIKDMYDMTRLGHTIKRLREKQGLSQEEFAEGICDRTFLSKLENGERKAPSIMMISKICQKLGISIDDLFLLAFGEQDEAISVIVSDINSYISAHNYEMAHELANKYLKNMTNAYYRQFYLFTEATYYFNKNNYQQVEFLAEEAINLTTSLTGPLYTLTELRLVNMILYINIVKYERNITPVISKTFNNYVKYLMNMNGSDYDILGHLYLDCCYYYLNLWEFESFINTYKAIEQIFITLDMKNHLKEGWNFMYIYHYFRNEEKDAKIYYDKLESFSKLFNDQNMMKKIDDAIIIFKKKLESKKRLSD